MQEKYASRQKYFRAKCFDPLLRPEIPVTILAEERQILFELAPLGLIPSLKANTQARHARRTVIHRQPVNHADQR
jgi:hypothetical protein